MQMASASQGSTIIQIEGDGNTVVQGLPHLRLTRYFNRREVRSDLDRLSPYTRTTRLIGREREMQDLQAFLKDPRPLLARVITGGAGRGKTRLGLELCEWASENGWQAGFAGRTEMARFFAQQDLATWGWQGRTLVVIDYAAQHSQELKGWFEELSARESRGPPLRLLLLERSATMQVGWCADVFASGSFADTSKRALLDPPEPVELAPLSEESRVALVEDWLRQFAPAGAELSDGARSPLNVLRGEDAGGDPLYLMMAAEGSVEAGGGDEVVLKRTDLAVGLARREAKRIADLAAGQKMDPRLAVHLVACVTLAQGMNRRAFQVFAATEKVAVQRPTGGDAAALADVLHEALPRTGAIAPIVPDLIGEAFVLESGLDTEALLRCYEGQGDAVLRTAIRCAQDFSPQRREPLEWLEAIEKRIAEDAKALEAMAAVLPTESVALRGINLSIARRVAAHHSRRGVRAEHRAAALEKLAIACANAGQGEAALKAAQEAVNLYRALARRRSAYRHELARSLVNLAIGLGDLGQREAAWKAAQEAVELYRKLAAAHPEDFLPALAASLSNLAITQSDLGQRQPALDAAQEAVRLYRDLAIRNPDVYRANLAGSLSNLAGRLSEDHQPEAALAVAQEAADIRRDLASQRPDIFRPALAKALSELAGMLSDVGHRELALQRAEEAVAMHRELSQRRPEVFRPDLGMSLGRVAIMRSELSRCEAAVEAAEEAVDLFRQLAASRPDYEPDLGRAQAVLAHCRGKLA